ncbi:hypothetical protein HOF65_04185 [bacterium]|nr:hypothetical protein [bacterium]MBT3853164.1 hypothetical protein [bacterium]MBT4633734.1 hypothetical protein [bacterium]MBT5491065.1 hypothetical protein [bacterium]MBT6779431.1 hypothetical protein [bacterium]
MIFFSFAISSYSSLSFFANFLGIFTFILINKSPLESLSICFTPSQDIFIIVESQVHAFISIALFQITGMFISFLVHKIASITSISNS